MYVDFYAIRHYLCPSPHSQRVLVMPCGELRDRMSAEIKRINALVYQGATRRYFTKKAAVRNIAKHLMDEHCYCDEAGSCKWHHTDGGKLGNGYPDKRLKRIIKWILRHQPLTQDKKEKLFIRTRRKDPLGMKIRTLDELNS